MPETLLNSSPKVSDEVKQTTCYMCACRCGIDVHLRDGRVRYIQGNRKHPVNRGVLCAKGSTGMLHLEAPSRLSSPLLRTGERGEGKFKSISWDEALSLATGWLGEVRSEDPRKLAFFTGRDQSQSLTGWWAQQYGTPNHAAHGGFCSVNMAAGGIYSIGGSFWEFGQPDWEECKLAMLFGVAEDHDSNPIKMGLSAVRRNGGKIISVNPVRTGYSAVADTWIGINPGTDGLLVLSIIGELLRSGCIDVDSLRYHTNAPWLVNLSEGPDKGLIVKDDQGNPLIVDSQSGNLVSHMDPNAQPLLSKTITTPEGQETATVFNLMVEKYLQLEFLPANVSKKTGVPASIIEGLARELYQVAIEHSDEINHSWRDIYGREHKTIKKRPVALHAMRGISAHSNGFQSCRALHLLQILLGTIDTPGGTRYKPPYPKPYNIHPSPARYAGPDTPLSGSPLGYPKGPEDLLIEPDGTPQRIDKAYSWEAPLAAHGMMHSVISNAAAKDPYPIEVLFLYMANMAWNSSMNTPSAMNDLKAKDQDGNYKIPKIIVSDAFSSEMTSFADLVLPDTTYFERYDGISLLDRPIGEPDLVADAIRYPVVEVTRNVRPFQDVLLELGGRLKLPGFVDENNEPKWKNYAHYLATHERKKGVGPLAGWRGKKGDESGKGEPNPGQIDKYIENGSFWSAEIPERALYLKNVNQDYQEWAVDMGFYDSPSPFKLEIYSETLRKFQLAGEGHGLNQPPEELRTRITETFDPFPSWYPPGNISDEDFPYSAITQRPMAMYHSWGSFNPWLRQIHSENRLFVPESICQKENLKEDDWVWVESPTNRIRVQIKPMKAVNSNTLWTWNAIGKRSGAWNLSPNSPETTKGFLLNHLISELLPEQPDGMRWANSDPITGQAAWYDLKVRIKKAKAGEEGIYPEFKSQYEPPDSRRRPTTLQYGKEWTE